MILALEAGYSDANDVVVTLTTDDEWISIVNGVIEIGDFENGATISLEDQSRPTFIVDEEAPVHYSGFALSLNSDEEYEKVFDLPMTVGHPLYMIVDDDGGENYQRHYSSDLDSNNFVHEIWSIDDKGLLEQDYLNAFSHVVWQTGIEEQPLDAEEQTLIEGYLRQGGYLLLSGQYIGDDIGDSEFHEEVLHALHVADNTSQRRLLGVPEHELFDSISLVLQGSGGAANSRSPSSMEPLDGAEIIFNYGTNGEGAAGAISYSGEDYTLFYFGFALEAVSGLVNSTRRQIVVNKIIEHFMNLDVEQFETKPVPADFKLTRLHPNPFNASTSIQVEVPGLQEFSVEVFDLSGRLVELIHSGVSNPGQRTFSWNGDGLPAGVYMVQLAWQGGVETQKAVLMK